MAEVLEEDDDYDPEDEDADEDKDSEAMSDDGSTSVGQCQLHKHPGLAYGNDQGRSKLPFLPGLQLCYNVVDAKETRQRFAAKSNFAWNGDKISHHSFTQQKC